MNLHGASDIPALDGFASVKRGRPKRRQSQLPNRVIDSGLRDWVDVLPAPQSTAPSGNLADPLQRHDHGITSTWIPLLLLLLLLWLLLLWLLRLLLLGRLSHFFQINLKLANGNEFCSIFLLQKTRMSSSAAVASVQHSNPLAVEYRKKRTAGKPAGQQRIGTQAWFETSQRRIRKRHPDLKNNKMAADAYVAVGNAAQAALAEVIRHSKVLVGNDPTSTLTPVLAIQAIFSAIGDDETARTDCEFFINNALDSLHSK